MKLTNTWPNLLALGTFAIAHSAYAQQISEQSLLPCDEVEQAILEQVTPEEVKRLNAYQPAQVIERKDPTYPQSAARSGNEGWVMMSYVIDVDGNVQDPIVEDFEGDKNFKRSAVRALKNWKFAPAMKDGKPTEQCHSAVRFDFTMSDANGASRSFVRIYKKARDLLASGDISGAEAQLAELKGDNDFNRYENAWMSSLEANIAKELGDDERELKAIGRTISTSATHTSEKSTFNDEYLGYLYQRSFVLETQLGYFADALQTAEKIAQKDNGESLIQPLQNTIDDVIAMIASDEHLVTDVNLRDSGRYFHSLARNKFAFIDIVGNLSTVEVRCETHREKFTVAEQYVWSIPASWGQCRVIVEGQQGANFALVEINRV